MPAPDFCSQIRDQFRGGLLFREPMILHTSWRIGGPADVLAEPRDVEDLVFLLKWAGRYGIPLTIIGTGTNLLVKDGGIDGVVVQIGLGISNLSIKGDVITAAAGLRLSRLTSAARDAGLGGFEFLSGIPGTVGGAVLMNAGAYGSNVSNLVEEVRCVDYSGNPVLMEGRRMDWGYRKSGLEGKSLIVVEAVFRGASRDRDLIQADMEKYINSRKAKQPIEYPSCGSVFKNPPGSYAGMLIEEAGCRGLRVGDAQVSLKHSNFIVNLGNASACDVLELIDNVRRRVFEKSGINLEMEVKVLGRD